MKVVLQQVDESSYLRKDIETMLKNKTKVNISACLRILIEDLAILGI